MKVKVYTTPACSYCQTLKEFLRENKVEFTEIDVSKDQQAAEELIRRSGQMSVPVTEIDGQMIVGFDREKLVDLLKLR